MMLGEREREVAVKQNVFDSVKCLRCGWRWIPRKPEQPRWCPACNSPYWNRKRVRRGAPKAKPRIRKASKPKQTAAAT